MGSQHGGVMETTTVQGSVSITSPADFVSDKYVGYIQHDQSMSSSDYLYIDTGVAYSDLGTNDEYLYIENEVKNLFYAFYQVEIDGNRGDTLFQSICNYYISDLIDIGYARIYTPDNSKAYVEIDIQVAYDYFYQGYLAHSGAVETKTLYRI